ncbi:MAG: hypothetical protein U9R58_01105 [Chloroflexota bacterium]|nr:hypothetical protein [Chloroflexota bacterium]
MNPLRVLLGTEKYGTRALLVDSQGNGHYTTIQGAIDAANSQSPTANSRWLIRVAPGEYTESLTLYDYIDIAGMAPGYTACLVTPPAQPAISSGAECTLSNLRIGGDNDPIIKTGTFTGTLRLANCVAEETDAGITFIQATSGSIVIRSSQFSVGGRLLYVTAGTVKAYDSILREYNTDSGGDTYAVIEIDGAATLEVQRCSLLNGASSGSGGAAVKITSTPTSVIFHNSLFRKASGTYAIDTTVTPAAYIANCAANAAIHPAITGTHDIQVDSNY